MTAADLAVEALLRTQFRRARPDDAILGEEYGAEGTSRRVWILDPIDGTSFFARGDPNWRIHLALEVEGVVELGVVDAPALGRRWWASRGGGSFEAPWPQAATSPTRLATSQTADLREATVATLPPDARHRLPAEARDAPPSPLPLVELVRGEIDAVLIEGAYIWDHAPWILLVEEAGGRFTNPANGRSGDQGGGLYSNAALHQVLLDRSEYTGRSGPLSGPRRWPRGDVRGSFHMVSTEQNVPVELPPRLRARAGTRSGTATAAKHSSGRADWSTWPLYDAAETGLRNYWYPVQWSSQVGSQPHSIQLCGERIMIQRDGDGRVHALHDRCLHRGVRLSQGREEFPGTVTCPYHGWTYRLTDGELVAVITDGPDSPMCGKVAVKTYPCEERIGLVWVFVGEREPHPIDQQLPEELVDAPPMAIGGRIEDRDGDWRLYAENGFDEGHAKYLHRTSLWRTFKMMPAWNKVHIEQQGRWIYRIEDERHWSADFPGFGTWTNQRWWKIKPKQQQGKFLGNTGGNNEPDPYIASRQFPGFASLSVPGVLRIAYPNFIHYEFYVPIDRGLTKYVGVMVQFKTGLDRMWFYLRYLFGIRWLFHGQFSGQDHWMVSETDAPPERLYRPDVSLLEWRRLVEAGNPFDSSLSNDDEGS